MLNQDFKSLPARREKKGIKRHHIHALALVAAVAGIIAIASPTHEAEAKRMAVEPAIEEASTTPVTLQPQIQSETLNLTIPEKEPLEPEADNKTEAKVAGHKEAEPVALRPEQAVFVKVATAPQPEQFDQTVSESPLSIPLAIPEQEKSPVTEAEVAVTASRLNWQAVKVRSGDSLSRIFERNKIPPIQLKQLLDTDKKAARTIKMLRPGQTLRLAVADNTLQALEYPISAAHKLTFQRRGEHFVLEEVTHPIERRLVYASGSIKDSLFNAGLKAGLSDQHIMELVGIFGWDIDFALDIRKNDRFALLYEELYMNGEKLHNGNIVAAEFTNQGRSFKAVRYTDPKGNSNYYSPDGHSMRKAFLRSPVDFRRISSRFSRERFHPVLGKKRPHRGVDYAAGTGTPIKASGDGKIIFRGTKGGYGRTVILQHGGKYTTLYAHMSGFKRGQRVGTRVKQGQIIGFVGKSGLATGPHLHYEFRVSGVHRNPLTVKFPNAAPIAKAYKQDFQQKSQPVLARLALQQQTQLALNQ